MSKETYTLTWSHKHRAFKVIGKNVYLRTELDEDMETYICTASHDFAGERVYYVTGTTPAAAIHELEEADKAWKGGKA